MKQLSIALGIVSLVLTAASVADTVRLLSGESIFCRVVADTTTSLSVEVPNAARTTWQTRAIPRTQIKTITFDSADFDALQQYQPTVNSALPVEDYDAGIKALADFLNAHPDSGYAAEVRQWMTRLTEEKAHIANGEVKFHKLWMTPEEKERQQVVAEASGVVQDLAARLSKLTTKRNQLAGSLAGDQQSIDRFEAKITTLPDRITIPTMNGKSDTHPNYDKLNQQQMLTRLKHQLSDGKAELARLDSELKNLQSQVKRAQERYTEIVIAQKQALPQPVPPSESNLTTVAVTPSVPAPTVAAEAPAPGSATSAEPLPWYRTHWYWLVGGICVGLFVLRRLCS